ncbi:type VI secretion system baseplate subunit TssF [Niveispirillum sp. KHB5.9]|uniref:type VI secretion system baseplate subunit TssF n=1 Tax=Niveispirillum sp. KHB5.9 TaxID=3400269 RepID=UPI003A882396
MTGKHFLDLYEEELRAIREDAVAFGRLQGGSAAHLHQYDSDPFVERLLEGFAFLTARVQVKMEAQFPRFTHSLLEMVQPGLLTPTPSMTIVRLDPDMRDRNLAAGRLLKAGETVLRPRDRREIRYVTAHDVTLYPLALVEAEYQRALTSPSGPAAAATLRLSLRCGDGVQASQLRLDSLPVFIDGRRERQFLLHEHIFANAVAVEVREPGRDRSTFLPADSIRPVGFSPAEAMLPLTDRCSDAFRLLREFFALPSRLCFARFTGLAAALSRINGPAFDILVHFKQLDDSLVRQVDSRDFALFCTPAINLFQEGSRPIKLKKEQSEYQILPDPVRDVRDLTAPGPFLDAHSVLSVRGTTHGAPARPFHPLFGGTGAGDRRYYTLARRPPPPGHRAGRSGLFIALVDGDQAPLGPDEDVLHVDLRCTNGNMDEAALQTSLVGPFVIDGDPPVTGVTRIVPATPQLPPPVDMPETEAGAASVAPGGRPAWQLVSHLSQSYLSLADGGAADMDAETRASGAALALRQMLLLHCPDHDERHKAMRRRVEAIRAVRVEPVVERYPDPAYPAWVRGVRITVEVTEPEAGDRGILLLGAVLEVYFSLHAAVNSFAQLVLRGQERGVVKEWPIRIGQRQLI